MISDLVPLLERATARRHAWFEPPHDAAFRLFNGFTEGCADLAIDVYGRTVVLHDHAEDRSLGHTLATAATAWVTTTFPWVHAVLSKVRHGTTEAMRNGVLVHGDQLDTVVREHGVTYAIDLTVNRDCSLYLDTRNLRAWAREHLRGQRVLNTFAYTGSLGVAALVGGATQVLQADLSARFLDVARRSYAANHLAIRRADFLVDDFFPLMARLNRTHERFDAVFLDPPFFSTTSRGVVDLERGITRLINKVRPLIADGGRLIVVNNALFVSGAAFVAELDALCADGYLQIETHIDVPDDSVGDPDVRFVVDPAPFRHPTKIVVMRVRRKAT